MAIDIWYMDCGNAERRCWYVLTAVDWYIYLKDRCQGNQ